MRKCRCCNQPARYQSVSATCSQPTEWLLESSTRAPNDVSGAAPASVLPSWLHKRKDRVCLLRCRLHYPPQVTIVLMGTPARVLCPSHIVQHAMYGTSYQDTCRTACKHIVALPQCRCVITPTRQSEQISERACCIASVFIVKSLLRQALTHQSVQSSEWACCSPSPGGQPRHGSARRERGCSSQTAPQVLACPA